jgi:hypothetical protein
VNYKERLAAQEAINLLTEVRKAPRPAGLGLSTSRPYDRRRCAQYYEKANPAAIAASAGGGAHEIATALEAEVKELKQGERSLFKIHPTDVGGLVYIIMAADAGASMRRTPCRTYGGIGRCHAACLAAWLPLRKLRQSWACNDKEQRSRDSNVPLLTYERAPPQTLARWSSSLPARATSRR